VKAEPENLTATPTNTILRQRLLTGISAAALLTGTAFGYVITAPTALAQVPAGVTIDPVNNDVSPSPATTPTWNVGGPTLIIGDTGQGELTIGAGGSIINNIGYLGFQAGSEGKATVAGGSWTNNSHLYVGWDGHAEMNIGANGSVSNTFGVVGTNNTSIAHVTVAGQGASWTNDSLYIGYDGKGTLDVGAGGSGSVTSTIGALGADAGAEGKATVAGAGALWTNSVRLYVGWDGTGDLTIRDGGHVAVDAGHGELLLGRGGTAIGTLTIGAPAGSTPAAAGTLAAGQISFGDGIATLVFNHSNPGYVFTPALVSTGTGTHTIQQIAGTTLLTGDSSGFTGSTTVSGGTLLVGNTAGNAALGGTMRVETNGTLGGNGTIGDTTIDGGTLSPGNSVGVLTVQGNLVMSTASTYLLEVSPAGSDFTRVTGSATLGSATVAAHYAPGSNVEKRYTILTADGGINGTFSGPANTNLPTNFKTALAHDANHAYLDLVLDYTPPPPPGPIPPDYGNGLNVNQNNVATTLVNFFNSTGGIPLAFGALSPQGLTQVSGELATGTQQATFDAMNLFLGLLTDPFVAGRNAAASNAPGFATTNDALGYAASGTTRTTAERGAYAAMVRKALPMAPSFEQRWSVWAAGYGGSQTTSGNDAVGSNTATSSIYGAAVGADYRLSPDTLIGFAMSGGATGFRIANEVGTGRSDLFQTGAFIRHHIGNAYLSGALVYGWQDVTTDRTVTAAGIERLRANFNANAFSGRLEGGYRIATPLAGITPYAAGQFTRYDLPSYAEQAGAGSLFALNYAAKDVTASRSELGLRTDRSFAFDNAILTLRSRAAWAHNFDTDRSIAATFQSLPGASFVVNGAAPAREAALVTGSAEMKWANGFALAATFEGEFSNTTSSYAGKGVVRYAW
jgi:T5SS/PEP-CTERM-associated repeat protein/autotransporter-associated beta strand protein